MGATDAVMVFKTNDRKEIERKFMAACVESKRENGSGGYTGTLAEFSRIAEWKDLQLANGNEANDYLLDNHEKWDEAMAVSFKLKDGSGIGWLVGGWVSE